MTENIYVVTDLGTGDGGKGGVVHKVSNMMSAHTVLKVGGAQGSHGVCTSGGECYAFSQWGCGTFEGIKTHITPNFVVSPEGVLNEGESIRYECGVHNVFSLLTIDERALCATPLHGIASRLKELARRENSRGTIGTGIGEAYRDATRVPELAIYARDLSSTSLCDKVAGVREQLLLDLAEIMEGKFLPNDQTEAEREIALLRDKRFVDHIVERFNEVTKRVKIVDPDYLAREILSQEGVAVIESSHGILTDHFHGFHPHTSAIRTLPCFTHAMLREAGYDGRIVNLGVTRAYQIRHGAGPIPTDDPHMAEHLLPGSSKEANRYQGKARVGPLDLMMLRYALDVCGGTTAFDGLAITWFDQIQTNGAWHICDQYLSAYDPTYFTPSGALRVRRGTDEEQIAHQENLGKRLYGCTPEITITEIASDTGRDTLFSLCADVLNAKLGVPVRMVSFGPTERDKVCK